MTGTNLLYFSKSKFPQWHSWELYLVPPDVRQNITSMLRNGHNKTASAYDGPAPALSSDRNIWTSVPGTPFPKTSLGYLTRYHISKYFLTVSKWAHWRPTAPEPRSELWRDTSAAWCRSSLVWEPRPPNWKFWERLTFAYPGSSVPTPGYHGWELTAN